MQTDTRSPLPTAVCGLIAVAVRFARRRVSPRHMQSFMPLSLRDRANFSLDRVKAQFGQRGAGIVLALAIEALFILAVLTLGAPMLPGSPEPESLTSVNIKAAPQPSEPEPEPAQSEPEPASQPPPSPKPTEPKVEDLPPPIPVKPIVPKAAPPAPSPPPPPPPPAPKPPQAEMGPMMGPPVPRSRTPDSRRVEGSGPNGEPLYAASWYREPRDGELRGYLSTATGPGWGLIACRTVPDYRVEDCVPIAEYPVGSNINRSILAAAWQFKVRPPRIGGRPMVGEWVRIRIDYGM